MNIYSIKTIALGKQEENSDYWVSDVNDVKIQEIATAISAKVNTVTPGSKWILYRGDDSHNTTGYVAWIEGNYLRIGTLINNVAPSNSANVKISVGLNRTNNDSGAKNAEFHYVTCKNGDVIFGVSNRAENADITDLSWGILTGTNIKEDVERVVYKTASTIFTDASTQLETFVTNSTNFTKTDFVVLAPFALGSLYIVCPNVYVMQYGKDSGNYGFMLNSKKYFVPNVVAENSYRIALELPDSAS